MTATAYFTKMKRIADEMETIGNKVDEDDMISQILAGLDNNYNPSVFTISAMTSHAN